MIFQRYSKESNTIKKNLTRVVYIGTQAEYSENVLILKGQLHFMFSSLVNEDHDVFVTTDL